ncbi:hypothetical protein FRC04_001509 [Tulasnella sp. 424]|nr:hypothetical protein FRC04_001509 [Tulasnella sp. 424]KAG8974574.1 hypothetical protein FRC05_007206 [Tulasnella sp. 425]
MFFKSLAVFSALAAGLANAVVHEVTVGGGGALVFTPNQITGAVEGDVIHFIFETLNGTATQGSFDKPCEMIPEGGFDSGFKAVDAAATSFPTYDLPINGTDPVWVVCRQAGHCKVGMVFAVNAPTENMTFDRFMANAKGTSSISMSMSMSMPMTDSSAPTAAAATGAAASKPRSTGNAAGRTVAWMNWKAMGAAALGVLVGAAVVV